MSDVDTAQADQVEQAPDPGDDAKSATAVSRERAVGERSPLMTAVRYLAMPLFLAVVLGGLYVWVQGQDLGDVEQRALTTDILVSATLRHVQLTVISTIIVLLIAIPLGIAATRPGRERLATTVVAVGNAGQAIPSLGLLTLIYFMFREISFISNTGLTVVVIALVAYSFLPILRNTMVGIRQVDENVLEAGKGMGMSNTRILRQIELPLAVPVILAGVRTALVLNVGTAALAFLYGGGGLGEVIQRGYQLSRLSILLTGAVLTAALALFVDYLAGIAEEVLTPEGL